MAGKYAKVCPLKLDFANSLYNYTEGSGEARLTEGNSAQRLEEALSRDHEGGVGVCCCESRVKKQGTADQFKMEDRNMKFQFILLVPLILLNFTLVLLELNFNLTLLKITVYHCS